MIACVRIPHFAAAIEAREHPRFLAQPVLVVRYTPTGRGKVAACSATAELVGVEVGMPSVRAAALCSEANLVTAAPSRYRRALLSVMESLSTYSQWMDVDKPYLQTATLYIDLGKLRPSDGRTLAQGIIDHLCREQGLSALVGLAADKFTALLAAHSTNNITLVPRGEEAAFLASQPVDLLDLDPELARRLALFGLEKLGQVAALSRGAMMEQFGEAGVVLHRRALGEDKRRVARYMPPQVEQAHAEFDPPVRDRLILQNVLTTQTETLAQRLKDVNLTCRQITLTLHLESGGQLEDSRPLRQPIHSASSLYRLTPHEGVRRVALELAALKPHLPQQLSLFDTAATPDPLAVVSDIAARYEESYFYTAALSANPSYLPEFSFHLTALDVVDYA
jgi:DNA polymerase IV